MQIEDIFSDLVIGVILACTGGIFFYLKKRFSYQDTIKIQISDLDHKVDALISIYIMILEKTHPKEVEKFKKLLKLAVKK